MTPRPILAALVALATAFPSAAMAEAALDGKGPLDTPLKCLARTVYFEARGQREREMRAVAHVVMNRVEQEAFPDKVCAVIKEGGARRGRCQFSFWCDGRSDVARNQEEFAEALAVAREVLDGDSTDPTDGANMFHARRVKPFWARKAEGRGQIGAHLFYYLEDR